MNHDLIQKLNNLKPIAPDAVFVKKCRDALLSVRTKKSPVFNWPVFVWSGAFAVLALAVSISVVLTAPKQAVSASLDPNKLNKEFNNLAINIQLQEISYRQNINQTITSALSEISDTNTKHLNKAILEKEKNDLNASQPQEQKIDELLETVIK